MSSKKKIGTHEIGLDIGVVLAKYFFKTEYMHYGYWKKGVAINVDNLPQAQEEYANLLLSNIPEGTKTILDVGCGIGTVAEKLLNAGYEVDCVSPSPQLTQYTRNRLGSRSHIYESLYQEAQIPKRYDMVLFSESFQYIPLEEALKKTLSLLNPGGHLLICDFFRKEVQGESPISGGHKLARFYEILPQYPLKTIVDLDITRETAPSLDIMDDILTNVVHPIWNAVAYYMNVNHPAVSKLFVWKNREKIEKAHRKYFTHRTNGTHFQQFKSYRLMVFQQK
ncbi:MAG: methyltransferase domain-containing protein [SAR324 cluster bacterium]|nr:methyltransferase domain-containing protein [SAR324 cluster bacterium]